MDFEFYGNLNWAIHLSKAYDMMYMIYDVYNMMYDRNPWLGLQKTLNTLNK